MDLLLAPQTSYSGGNFVAPDGAFVYYTQARGSVLCCLCWCMGIDWRLGGQLVVRGPLRVARSYLAVPPVCPSFSFTATHMSVCPLPNCISQQDGDGVLRAGRVAARGEVTQEKQVSESTSTVCIRCMNVKRRMGEGGHC